VPQPTAPPLATERRHLPNFITDQQNLKLIGILRTSYMFSSCIRLVLSNKIPSAMSGLADYTER
jgi:hypothetical protein